MRPDSGCGPGAARGRLVVRVLGIGIAVGMLTLGPPMSLVAQTPADSARILFAIADDLRSEGRVDLAESLYELIVTRFGLTPVASFARSALDSLRQHRYEGSGRGELIAWNTIYGAALGLMIPAALGADEPEPYGVGLLLGAPAGFLASKAYANSTSMSGGQARAITFGTWWGMWQGFGWREVLDLGDRTLTQCFDTGAGEECVEFVDDSEEAPFAALVIGGLGGLTTGALLARSMTIPRETALVSNFASLWGSWYGAAAAVIANVENDDGLLAAALVGGNVGLLSGLAIAPATRMSTRRAWLIHLAGIAGGVAGLGLDLLVQPDDEEVAVLLPVITSAVGLAAGFASTTEDPGRAEFGRNGMGLSLLDWSPDGLALGIPVPVPTLLTDPARPTRTTPGVRLELFRASW